MNAYLSVYGPGGGEFDLALNQGFLRNVMEINRVNGLEKFEEGAVFLPVNIMSFFKVQKIRRIFQVKSAQSLRSFVKGSTPVSRRLPLSSQRLISKPPCTRAEFVLNLVFYAFLRADDGSAICVFAVFSDTHERRKNRDDILRLRRSQGVRASTPKMLVLSHCQLFVVIELVFRG